MPEISTVTTKVIAIIRRSSTATPEQLAPDAKAEVRASWDLYLAGIVEQWYRRTDHPGGVLVLACQNVDEAKVALSALPHLRDGLIEVELVPVGPF